MYDLKFQIMEDKLDVSCLQTANITLPGGLDKEGRPIFLVTLLPETASLQITVPIKYLLSIFRYVYTRKQHRLEPFSCTLKMAYLLRR